MTVPVWHEEAITKRHDRKAFDCGDPDLNLFLQCYARQSHEQGGAKTFLAIDDGDGQTIHGYCSLAPAALTYRKTPESIRRGLDSMMFPVFVLHASRQICASRAGGLAVSFWLRPRCAAFGRRARSVA